MEHRYEKLSNKQMLALQPCEGMLCRCIKDKNGDFIPISEYLQGKPFEKVSETFKSEPFYLCAFKNGKWVKIV